MRKPLFVCLALFSLAMSGTSAAASPKQLTPLQQQLQLPESQIDLVTAKLAIDKLIDPKLDTAATIKQIDALADRIKARLPASATNQAKMEILVTSLAQPGPWNDYRPFRYDLDDPFGQIIRNKLLSTYLETRKGNCVSMPVLLVILGHKLGLEMTLATAPEHVLTKFKADNGQWVNIEATSFGTKQNAGYQQEMSISPRAMITGIYLRPLGRKESVGVMASTLMEYYGQEGRQNERIAVADLVLEANPTDVVAMLQKGNAYYLLLKQRYIARYPSPDQIPAAERADFNQLGRSNMEWFAKAESLGWVEPSQRQNADYLQHIQRANAQQGGG